MCIRDRSIVTAVAHMHHGREHGFLVLAFPDGLRKHAHKLDTSARFQCSPPALLPASQLVLIAAGATSVRRGPQCQTLPAELLLAHAALHVVASCFALNWGAAAWAVPCACLDTVLTGPLLRAPLPPLSLSPLVPLLACSLRHVQLGLPAYSTVSGLQLHESTPTVGLLPGAFQPLDGFTTFRYKADAE